MVSFYIFVVSLVATLLAAAVALSPTSVRAAGINDATQLTNLKYANCLALNTESTLRWNMSATMDYVFQIEVKSKGINAGTVSFVFLDAAGCTGDCATTLDGGWTAMAWSHAHQWKMVGKNHTLQFQDDLPNATWANTTPDLYVLQFATPQDNGLFKFKDNQQMFVLAYDASESFASHANCTFGTEKSMQAYFVNFMQASAPNADGSCKAQAAVAGWAFAGNSANPKWHYVVDEATVPAGNDDGGGDGAMGSMSGMSG